MSSPDGLKPLLDVLSIDFILAKHLRQNHDNIRAESLQELLIRAGGDDGDGSNVTTRSAVRIIVTVLDDAVQVWSNLFLDQELGQRQKAFDAACAPNARQLVSLLSLGPRRLPPGVVSTLCSTIVQLVRVTSVSSLCLVAGSLVVELVDTAKDAFQCCNNGCAAVATHRQYTRPLLIAAQNILRRTGRHLFADINYLPAGLINLVNNSLDQLCNLVDITQRNFSSTKGSGSPQHREIPLMRSGLDEMGYEQFRLVVYMLDHMAFCAGSVGGDFTSLVKRLLLADEVMLGPKQQHHGVGGVIAAPKFGLLDALSREVLVAFFKRVENSTKMSTSGGGKSTEVASPPRTNFVSEKRQPDASNKTQHTQRAAVVKQLSSQKFSKEELLRFMEAKELEYAEERQLVEDQLRIEERKTEALQGFHATQMQQVGELTNVAVGGEKIGTGSHVIALIERQQNLKQKFNSMAASHQQIKEELSVKIVAEQQVTEAEEVSAKELADEAS